MSADVEVKSFCKDDTIQFDNPLYKLTATANMPLEKTFTVDISKEISDLEDVGDISLHNITESVYSSNKFDWLKKVTIETRVSETEDEYILFVEHELTAEEQTQNRIDVKPTINCGQLFDLLKNGPIEVRLTAIGNLPEHVDINNSICTDISIKIVR